MGNPPFDVTILDRSSRLVNPPLEKFRFSRQRKFGTCSIGAQNVNHAAGVWHYMWCAAIEVTVKLLQRLTFRIFFCAVSAILAARVSYSFEP
jgi:hypothetical protein